MSHRPPIANDPNPDHGDSQAGPTRGCLIGFIGFLLLATLWVAFCA